MNLNNNTIAQQLQSIPSDNEQTSIIEEEDTQGIDTNTLTNQLSEIESDNSEEKNTNTINLVYF